MLYFLFATLAFSSAFSAHVTDPLSEKIVGGNAVDIRDYKYQVVILHLEKLWCGGSILTKRNVLTASHCVFFSSIPLMVRAGSSFWSKGGSLHHVDRNHTAGFSPDSDVAVLRVQEPFVFDDTRQPVPLAPTTTLLTPGKLAVVTGWGWDDDDLFPEQLRAVEVPLVDKEKCNKAYNESHIAEIVYGQLCAGTVHKDSCKGDSGSPLVLDGGLIGVVSMGRGCGRLNFPGVYADVIFYHDWIIQYFDPEDRF